MDNTLIGERIRAARKAAKLTQEELGEKLGLSSSAVSYWETGKFIPDAEHLPALAEALNLSLDSLFTGTEKDWKLKPVNFSAERMHTYVKSKAQALGMRKTLQVMELLRDAHGGQERKSRYGFAAEYRVHPLTLACHALAMGLQDDEVIAACLAHDMIEDSEGRVRLADLPEGRVREAVRRVSKTEYKREPGWEKKYYESIRKDPLACMVKCLDRVNNLAGMADGFSRRKMIRYTEETDRHYPALLEEIRKVQEWNNAWWLLRYQMVTTLEAFKRLL